MVTQFNYANITTLVDKILKVYGRPIMSAYLRREGSDDREVTCVESSYRPDELTDLIQSTDRRFIVSAEGMTVIPDKELDTLIIIPGGDDSQSEELLLASPPSPMTAVFSHSKSSRALGVSGRT